MRSAVKQKVSVEILDCRNARKESTVSLTLVTECRGHHVSQVAHSMLEMFPTELGKYRSY